MESLGRTYLAALRAEFAGYRRTAERALDQLSSDDLTRQLDPESNSVAMLVQHIAGNLTSRFADFLRTDGEKPSRDRDAEFVAGAVPGDRLRDVWDHGWETLFAAIDAIGPDDLERTVTIRLEPHSVVAALERSLAHTAQHVGQIVFLAKHLRGPAWRTLSIPRGQSRTWRPGGGAGSDGR